MGLAAPAGRTLKLSTPFDCGSIEQATLIIGSEAALEQLTRQMGIMFMKVNDADNTGAYLVDHTASVFLFDPDGRYHAIFSPPLSVDAIAGDFQAMAGDFR